MREEQASVLAGRTTPWEDAMRWLAQRGRGDGMPLVDVNLNHANLDEARAAELCARLARCATVGTLLLEGNSALAGCVPELGAALASNTALHTLCLAAVPLGDARGAALLRACRGNATLRELSMSSCGVGVETCEALGVWLAEPHCVLEKVHLAQNGDVRDDGLAALAAGVRADGTLQYLNVGSCGVSARGALSLLRVCAHHTALVEVGLWGNAIGGCADALAELGAQGAHVQILGMQSTRLTDGDAAALLGALHGRTPLRTLLAGNNALGTCTATALADAWEHHDVPLETLFLSGNSALGAGPAAARMASGVAHSTHIRDLYLSGCKLDTAALRALGAALARNASLRVLHLERNHINAAASRALANGLSTNATLTSLHLGMCKIGEEALVTLCDALASSAVCTLDLSRTPLTSRGVAALAELLSKSTALTALHINNATPQSEAVRVQLLEALGAAPRLAVLHGKRTGLCADADALASMVRDHAALRVLHVGDRDGAAPAAVVEAVRTACAERRVPTELHVDAAHHWRSHGAEPPVCLAVVSGMPACGKTALCAALHRHAHAHLVRAAGWPTETRVWIEHVCYDAWDDNTSNEADAAFSPDVWHASRQRAHVHVRALAERAWEMGVHDRVLVLVDDNMQYRSMRHAFHQLAREQQCGVAFVHVCADAAVREARNAARAHPVPPASLEALAAQMEPPSTAHTGWERFVHVADSTHTSAWTHEHVQAVCGVVARAWASPVPPVDTGPSAEERKAERQRSLHSVLQQLDVRLRKQVGQRVRSAPPGADRAAVARAANARREQVLRDVRRGVLVLTLDTLDLVTL